MFWQNAFDVGWFLFLGLIVAYFWRARQAARQPKFWIKIKGQITRCEWAISGDSKWPTIEYHYKIDGQEYIGSSLFLDTTHNVPQSAYVRYLVHRAAIAYEQKQELDVYYNPKLPEQAVLDTTIPRKLDWILGVITLLIIWHVVMFFIRLT
jgi:hypothetical protein